MTTHSSILAWRIPRTEEPAGLLLQHHNSKASILKCSPFFMAPRSPCVESSVLGPRLLRPLLASGPCASSFAWGRGWPRGLMAGDSLRLWLFVCVCRGNLTPAKPSYEDRKWE